MNPWGRPPLRRSGESVLPRFRRCVDITRNSDEGGEHASRICAIYLLYLVAHVRVQLICMETALTSMLPVRANGMRAVIWMA